MKGAPRLEVVSGVIVAEGRVLLTQRDPKRSDFGWYWETPGGKVEQTETLTEALHRELLEELGVEVMVGELLGAVDMTPAEYPELKRPVRVTFYGVHLIEAKGMPRALYSLDLAPANHEFRRQLVEHMQDVEKADRMIGWEVTF